MSDYPHTLGSKGGGASEEAAVKFARSRRVLIRQVLELFERRRRWTPDAAAKKLGQKPEDIRPRFSELLIARIDRDGNVVRHAYLRKTERRGKSYRGNSQTVYERLPEQIDMWSLW